jgi:hypothetical protein
MDNLHEYVPACPMCKQASTVSKNPPGSEYGFVCSIHGSFNCMIQIVDNLKKEEINHPDHYNVGGIEVIDAIEAWKLGFNLGNAIKYIARADTKGMKEKDLRKAIWYIQRELGENKKNDSTRIC